MAEIHTTAIEQFGLADDIVAKLRTAGVAVVGDLVAKTPSELAKMLGEEAVPPAVTESLELFELKLVEEPRKGRKLRSERIDEAAASELPGNPLLTEEAVKAIRERARRKVDDERREAAEDKLYREYLAELRAETGPEVMGGPGDDQVTVYVDLADHSAAININGKRFWHGHTYTMSRHVADSVREMMARGQRHQDEIDGKSLAQHYQRARATELSPVRGIKNAASMPA